MGFETADRLRKPIAFRAGLPARLTGHFSRHNWDERALIGAHLMDQRQQLGARIAFDVEFDRGWQRPKHTGDLADVIRCDVTSVCAGMHGDAGRARRDARPDRLDDAWRPPAARVAQGCDLVDVHGQTDH